MTPIKVIFIIISLYLVVYDVKYKRVPNLVILFLFCVICDYTIKESIFLPSLGNGLLAFTFFTLIYIKSNKGLGFGDVKYTSLTCFCFGYKFWLNSVLIGSITAILVLFPLYLLKIVKKRSKIPFIPFLVTGVIIVIITDLTA